MQDFIRQARSTRDLWAGSYLLNYLIAKAMFAVARPVGPESIVHPQLRGVPLVDWFAKPAGFRGDEKRPDFSKDRLTPNLPNRFLALVPQDWRDPQGRTIAQVAEQAVRTPGRKSKKGCVRAFVSKWAGRGFCLRQTAGSV